MLMEMAGSRSCDGRAFQDNATEVFQTIFLSFFQRFGKVGRLAAEPVTVELLKSKMLAITVLRPRSVPSHRPTLSLWNM